MSDQKSYQHWKLEIDSERIAWLYFDRADSSTNTIIPPVLTELSEILAGFAEQASARGVIIASAKKTGFIAGADVNYFGNLTDTKEAIQFILHGQQVFAQIEALKVPVVAMIDGFCLGGGLELALACHYRIAEDGPKTKLGLPEILLGIHPGWGGSVRLPRLIGAIQAMDLILTGRTEVSKKAVKTGFIDAAVPRRHLRQAARYYVLKKPQRHQPSLMQKASNNKLIRPLIAKTLRSKVAQKVSREHYPAPFAMIDKWERDGVDSPQAIDNEAVSIEKLLNNDTARNLIRVFFLRERLKSLGKTVEFSPRHIHVIGAGTMGGDIAAWCAYQGFNVTLQDREPKNIAPAIKRAFALFSKKYRAPRDIQAAMDRIMPDPQGLGISKADIIIEAIFEQLDAKQALFKELEAKAKVDAILATNTSSIPLTEIATAMKDPSRLVGIHFFNPVARMLLVEVVSSDVTASSVTQKAIAFVHKLDRLPLPVKSSPGFLVNRVLMPYMLEAMNMLEEGISAADIDKAAVNFGMPMGPIELADTVGLDVCLSVAENLSQHFGGIVPERLRQMVAEHHLGRKTGSGFYQYQNGKLEKETLPVSNADSAELAKRLITRMVEEAVACLNEHVVADSDLLDAGMVFGTGFAPFRGGPIHYAKSIHMAEVEKF